MNKRLKLEVSNHLRAMQRAFIPGTSKNQAPLHCIPKISSELQTGPKQKAVVFDVTLLGCGEPGELEISGLCGVSRAEQQLPWLQMLQGRDESRRLH